MQIYGILAHPAKHSLSPNIHNAGFKALDIDAYYEKFDITPEELEDFMLGVRDEDIKGLSVSLPHKVDVIKYLDEISDDAAAMGAVNTIENKDGKLIGHNFDWIGVVKALEKACDLDEKLCFVLGAGGAARAAVYGLKKKGAKIVILNRTLEKARALAEEFSCEYGELGDERIKDADVIVQTTSCWLSDDQTQLIDPALLNERMLVMDIVYKPLMTPLLEDAEKAGAQIVTGEKMLLYQAYEQFELWTGKGAPKDRMQQSLMSKLS